RYGGALALEVAADRHSGGVELRGVAEFDVSVHPDSRLEDATGAVRHLQVLDVAPAEAEVLADVDRALLRQLRGRGAERRRGAREGHRPRHGGAAANEAACRGRAAAPAAPAATGGQAECQAQGDQRVAR